MLIKHHNIKFNETKKQEHDKIRSQVEADKLRIQKDALAYKQELDIRINALKMLKAKRQACHLTLGEVASRSGIDKARLSKLENDPYPNPTLETLMRIADAIDAHITINITSKAA